MAKTADCRSGKSLTLKLSKWCGRTANASATRLVGALLIFGAQLAEEINEFFKEERSGDAF
jgi:hypothetical protein